MKRKKIAEIVIIVLVLLVSLTYFPLMGMAFGWPWFELSSLIITCVFVFVWLIVLLVAAIMKSKALINMHLCYWLAVIVFGTIAIAFGFIAAFETFTSVLVVFFMIPIIGIHYLFPNSSYAIYLFIPLCMFLLGLFFKVKFIKKLPNEQSE